MNVLHDTLKGFLQDPSFRNWAYKANIADQEKWDYLLEANPAKKEMAEQAVMLLKGIAFLPARVPEFQEKESWQRLKRRIALQDTVAPVAMQPYTSKLRQCWTAALVILCSGMLYYFIISGREQIYRTNFGETATLILPDSSTVVLNGNTTLHYNTHWHPNKRREVWLEGEAFFNVLKKPGQGNAHFIVHTPEINVKVLGTRFNVTNRRRTTKVVLTSGKVHLSAASQPEKAITALLKPGEMAELAHTQQRFHKSRVNPELYSSWIDKKLIFQATPLADIVLLLQENYGFKVQIADPQLLTRKIAGEIYIDDVNTLLVALATSFNLKLERQGYTLRITSDLVAL